MSSSESIILINNNINWDQVPKITNPKWFQVTKTRNAVANIFLGSAVISGLGTPIAAAITFTAKPILLTAAVSVPGLLVLTAALVITGLLIRRMGESPLDPDVRLQKRKEAEKAFTEGILFADVAQYNKLLEDKIVTSEEIQKHLAFEIKNLSYKEFVDKYKISVLGILSVENKASLQAKFIIYVCADAKQNEKTATQVEKEFTRDFTLFDRNVKEQVLQEVDRQLCQIQTTTHFNSELFKQERSDFIQKCKDKYKAIPTGDFEKRRECLQWIDAKEQAYQRLILDQNLSEKFFTEMKSKSQRTDSQVEQDKLSTLADIEKFVSKANESYQKLTGTNEFRTILHDYRNALTHDILMALDDTNGLRHNRFGYLELVSKEEHSLKSREEETAIENRLIEYLKFNREYPEQQPAVIRVMTRFLKLKSPSKDERLQEFVEGFDAKKALENEIQELKQKFKQGLQEVKNKIQKPVDTLSSDVNGLMGILSDLDNKQALLFNLLQYYEDYFILSEENENLKLSDAINSFKDELKKWAADVKPHYDQAKSDALTSLKQCIEKLTAGMTAAASKAKVVKGTSAVLTDPSVKHMKTFDSYEKSTLKQVFYLSSQGALASGWVSNPIGWNETFFKNVESLPDFFKTLAEKFKGSYTAGELNLAHLQDFLLSLQAVNSHLEFSTYPRISAVSKTISSDVIALFNQFIDQAISSEGTIFELLEFGVNHEMKAFPVHRVREFLTKQFGARLTEHVLQTYLNDPKAPNLTRLEVERLLIGIAVDVRIEDIAERLRVDITTLTEEQISEGLKSFRQYKGKNFLEHFSVPLTFDKKEVADTYLNNLPKATKSEKLGKAALCALADMESVSLWQGPRRASMDQKEALTVLKQLCEQPLSLKGLDGDPYFVFLKQASAAFSILESCRKDPSMIQIIGHVAVAAQAMQLRSLELYPASVAAIYGNLWYTLSTYLREAIAKNDFDSSRLCSTIIRDPKEKVEAELFTDKTNSAREAEFIGRKISYLMRRYYSEQNLDIAESAQHLKGTLFTNSDGETFRIESVTTRPSKEHGYVLMICAPVNTEKFAKEGDVPLLILFQGTGDTTALTQRDAEAILKSGAPGQRLWDEEGAEVFDKPLSEACEELQKRGVGMKGGARIEFVFAGHSLGSSDVQNGSVRVPNVIESVMKGQEPNYIIKIRGFNSPGAARSTLEKFKSLFGENGSHKDHLSDAVKSLVMGDDVSLAGVGKVGGDDKGQPHPDLTGKVFYLELTPPPGTSAFPGGERHTIYAHANTTPLYPLRLLDENSTHFEGMGSMKALANTVAKILARLKVVRAVSTAINIDKKVRVVADQALEQFRKWYYPFMEIDELRLQIQLQREKAGKCKGELKSLAIQLRDLKERVDQLSKAYDSAHSEWSRLDSDCNRLKADVQNNTDTDSWTSLIWESPQDRLTKAEIKCAEAKARKDNAKSRLDSGKYYLDDCKKSIERYEEELKKATGLVQKYEISLENNDWKIGGNTPDLREKRVSKTPPNIAQDVERYCATKDFFEKVGICFTELTGSPSFLEEFVKGKRA